MSNFPQYYSPVEENSGTVLFIFVAIVIIAAAVAAYFLLNNNAPKQEAFILVGPTYDDKNQRGYEYTFDQAKAAAKELGFSLATLQQLKDSHSNGADWCIAGWMSDGTAYYPIQNPRNGCGIHAVNKYDGEISKAGITLYGVKPPIVEGWYKNKYYIVPFNRTKWSQYD